MKEFKLSMMFLSLISLLAVSCIQDDVIINNDGENVPDAVVNLTVTKNGAQFQSISYTLPKQVVTGGPSANGSFSSSLDKFSLNFQDGSKWQVGISVKTGDVSNGTYKVDGEVEERAAYNNDGDGGVTTTNGSITLTKVNEVIGDVEWFVDGNLKFTVTSQTTPADTYVISGSFSGINVKGN